jgi:hypothetical protein
MQKWLETVNLDKVTDFLHVFCSQDFTKRQTNVMAFLLRCSLKNNRAVIYIPNLKDFENCGVSRTKITETLESLEDLKCIIWDRENQTFQINPKTIEWGVKPFKTFDHQRVKQIDDLNCC